MPKKYIKTLRSQSQGQIRPWKLLLVFCGQIVSCGLLSKPVVLKIQVIWPVRIWFDQWDSRFCIISTKMTFINGLFIELFSISFQNWNQVHVSGCLPLDFNRWPGSYKVNGLSTKPPVRNKRSDLFALFAVFDDFRNMKCLFAVW